MPLDASLLESAIKDIRLPISKEKFRVFVFGPALSPSEVVAEPTTDIKTHDGLLDHAKYLRYLTTVKLREAGWIVDFGETLTIRQFWATLGIKNPAAMELSHAKKLCGAIIIFPASIGAICELSLFANQPFLAEKTLAIVHSEFKEHQSFFRLGLLKLLKIRQGSFEFENYQDFTKCAEYALEYVEDRWTNYSLDDDAIAEGHLLALKREGSGFEKST